jgi:hypothetical protein
MGRLPDPRRIRSLPGILSAGLKPRRPQRASTAFPRPRPVEAGCGALHLAPKETPDRMIAQIDISQALQLFIVNLSWFLGLFALLVIAKILGSAGVKGWIGERAVSKGLSHLDPVSYVTFHDLYLPRPDRQGTTQLDHVVVSPFGIFVVETKNYQGWIFGSEKQREWTQQIYRKK